MATAWVRAPSMERMGSLAALRASHRLARSLRCEPRLWQRPQSARAEADLTRLGWQCGQRCSLCAAAQRSRLVFSGPLHGCLGCQGARTHAPAISRGAVAGFVPFSSRAHSAPPDEGSAPLSSGRRNGGSRRRLRPPDSLIVGRVAATFRSDFERRVLSLQEERKCPPRVLLSTSHTYTVVCTSNSQHFDAIRSIG